MKKKRIIGFLIVVAIVSAAATYMVYAQPGAEEDPIVTLSYINEVLKKEMTFKVVEVPSGKSIYGGAGAEMVLRMGKGTIIATEKGGVADLTSGNDLPDGAVVPANHHLLVPLDDGRGLNVSADSLVLVKGTYEIK